MVDYRLSVSDDFENLLRDLIEYVLSPTYFGKEIEDEIEEKFSPDGKGVYFPRAVGARRVHDVKDGLPRYMWDNPPVDIYEQEIWIVDDEAGDKVALIEGDELRYLIKESKRVQEEHDNEFMAKYNRPFSYSAVRELKEAGVLQ
jgi:hypothetical protein